MIKVRLAPGCFGHAGTKQYVEFERYVKVVSEYTGENIVLTYLTRFHEEYLENKALTAFGKKSNVYAK